MFNSSQTESALTQAPTNQAKNDRFVLELAVPQALKKLVQKYTRGADILDTESFLVSIMGTVTPNISVPAVDIKYSGTSLRVSSHTRPVYSTLPMRFIVDNQFRNYYFIYAWLDILADDYNQYFDEEYRIRDHTKADELEESYMTNMSILMYDQEKQPVMKFDYFKCFPVSLGSINTDYATATQIEVTAEFAFSKVKATPLFSSGTHIPLS